ncbi:MAG: manganese efflux pump MntP family protein [Spirochaetaceae bacterium]|jgi:putative Mn2+ efflux pump MntP|nr:manganese efflux pump MntP family protein [Spirochaetaceae bacterium]
MFSVILIAFSLSMDAFTISLSAGISIRGLRRFYMVRAAFFFGLFQFIMPLLGWYLGKTVQAYIEVYDHWIAFGLLAFIGGKMFVEGFNRKDPARQGDEPGKPAEDIRSLAPLLALSLATSIDALAVGISFTVLGQGIWFSAALIGGITFLVCLTGFGFGKRLGRLFGKWAERAGGLILIAIGLKILLDHLLGSPAF